MQRHVLAAGSIEDDSSRPVGICSTSWTRSDHVEAVVDFHRVEKCAEFLALLQRFADDYRQTGRSPVLQIETKSFPGASHAGGYCPPRHISWTSAVCSNVSVASIS